MITPDGVKDFAYQLGFTKVALLPPDDLTDQAPYLLQWLAAGYHADMDWMKTHANKRLSPRQLMPTAQTIIMTALNYYQPAPPNRSFQVSRYAMGEDYHRVIKHKLYRLLQWIRQAAPTHVEGKAFVDSAPVLEKALAVRAGFGWQGKHSNVISQDYGSWLFLGGLMVDLALPPDSIAPVTDYCGRCRRCLDACPTEAIVAEGQVDANRCLAYWTIESRVERLPSAIQENLQGWVFGCDICQDVCPWNERFAQPTEEAAFLTHHGLMALSTDAVLALTSSAFKRLTSNTPLYRTGVKRFKRNIRALSDI